MIDRRDVGSCALTREDPSGVSHSIAPAGATFSAAQAQRTSHLNDEVHHHGHANRQPTTNGEGYVMPP